MKKTDIPRVKRTQRDYTLGFTPAVVKQVEKGDITYKQAQQHYGIQGRSTMFTWSRKHGKQDWSNQLVYLNQKKHPLKNQALREKLADLQLKNDIMGGMLVVVN